MWAPQRLLISGKRSAGRACGKVIAKGMVLSDNIRGALFMAGSMAAFTINDAFMKSLSGELHLVQAIFVRSIGVIVALALLAWSQNALRLKVARGDLKLTTLRSGAEIIAIYLFMTALFNMPLANAAAILQALPLTVTLAGALFLGEAVGWRRIGAILIGFLGVLLIVQPGGEGFTIYSLYALAAVGFVTIRDLAARQLSAEIPSLMVALLTAAWGRSAWFRNSATPHCWWRWFWGWRCSANGPTR